MPKKYKRTKTRFQSFGEFDLIARIQSKLPKHAKSTILSIGDDAAVLKPDSGSYLLTSTDTLVENTHFNLSTISPEQLGRKSLAVNLSDIAAMGGHPKWVLVSIGIPKTLPLKFLDRFYNGLQQMSARYNIDIVGGDTVSSKKHFYITISVLGEALKKKYFSRGNAKPGDKIFVTGTLGDSALGLKILLSKKIWKGSPDDKRFLIQKHLDPIPCLEEVRLIKPDFKKVGAMIDISDGLLQDLSHICRTSKVGAMIRKDQLPNSQPFESLCLINKNSPWDFMLKGGEDYELLFTFRPENDKNLKYRFKKAGKSLTQIGVVTEKPGKLVLLDPESKAETLSKPFGFDHFAIKI